MQALWIQDETANKIQEKKSTEKKEGKMGHKK